MIVIAEKKGFALVFSLLVVLLIVLICASYFSVAANDLVLANRITDSIRAYYIADAGLADAFMKLRAADDVSAIENSYPVGPGNRTGSYNAHGVSDGADWPTYTITSQGTYHGIQKTLILEVHMVSFSRWSYISDGEVDPKWGPLFWVTGMIMTGPFFTNGQFNMCGTPTFDGPVGQVNPRINYFHVNSNPDHNPSGVLPLQDNPNFQNGVTLNAPSLDVFTVFGDALNNISAAAATPGQGVLLTGVTAITLLSDGTMNVTNQNNNWDNQNIPMPADGAVFVQGGNVTMPDGTQVYQNGDVTVQCSPAQRLCFKGQLTIGSDNNIYLGSSILYHDKVSDKITYSGDDLLGLVAQNNVIVNDLPKGDLEFDGYIVALRGAFQVQNFLESFKGNMIQFGGLANLLDGPTCLFDPSQAGKIIDGYVTLQYYDSRLQETAPLWFPAVKDAAGRITYVKLKLNEL